MDINALTLQGVQQLIERDAAVIAEGSSKICYGFHDMACVVILQGPTIRNERACNMECERLQRRLNYLRRVKGVRCHKLIKYFYDTDKHICYQIYTKAPGEEMLIYSDSYSRSEMSVEDQQKRMDRLLAGPQAHFDEFVRSVCEIAKAGLDTDYFCRNIMYDGRYGFTFIDLNYYSGLDEITTKTIDVNPNFISNVLSSISVYQYEKNLVATLNDEDRKEYYGKRVDILLKFAQGMVNNGFSLDTLEAGIGAIRKRCDRFDFLDFKSDFGEMLNNLKPQTLQKPTRATWLR